MSRGQKRFSLLLLEEHEQYFCDAAVSLFMPPAQPAEQPRLGPRPTSVPVGDRRKVKGRLIVASKSLLFDPEDWRFPVLRFAYRDTKVIDAVNTTRSSATSEHDRSNASETFLVYVEKVCEMKADGKNGPYVFRKLPAPPKSDSSNAGSSTSVKTSGLDMNMPSVPLDPAFLLPHPSQFIFELSFATVVDFLPLVQRLLHVSRLDARDARKAALKILHDEQSASKFDASWIVDLREKIVFPDGKAIPAVQVSPLVEEAGSLMLTNQRLYFQPLHSVSAEPVHKLSLSDVRRVCKRRYAMRQCGLELFVKSNNSSTFHDQSFQFLESKYPSVFFSFPDSATRDRVYGMLLDQSECAMNHQSTPTLVEMTQAWTEGKMSNFDYLLALNLYAGRSFNDLCQYPVFPWVLSDYTSASLDLNNSLVYRDLSKPVGALNQERLQVFLNRYRDMPSEADMGHPPFLYGTHYSTPGYCLYFMVRRVPDYMLRLQSGQFDKPDRLFSGIEKSWQSVLKNSTDLKELIPEFYHSNGEFMLNSSHLELGSLASGQPVNDVVLPPWASDAADFVRKQRQALESKFVSENLHHWIDLIFGCKQNGPSAVRAHNVFFYLTYEGAVDLDDPSLDDLQRSSIEAQINEFGQTPTQLFPAGQPHPMRKVWNGPVLESELTFFSEVTVAASDEHSSRRSSFAFGAQIPTTPSRSQSFQQQQLQQQQQQLQQQQQQQQQLQAQARRTRSEDFQPSTPLPAANAPKPETSSWSFSSLVSSISNVFSTPTSDQPPPPSTPSQPSQTQHVRSKSNIATPSAGISNASTSAVGASGSVPRPRSIDQSFTPKHTPIRAVSSTFNSFSASSSATSALLEDLSDVGTQESAPVSDVWELTLAAPSTPTPVAAASAAGSFLSPIEQLSPVVSSKKWSADFRKLSAWPRLNLHRDTVNSVALAPAERELLFTASADGSLKIFDLRGRKLKRSVAVSDLTLSSCASCNSGRLVALGSFDNQIYLYSVDNGRTSNINAHDDAVSCLASTSAESNAMLVSGSWDSSVKVWNIETSSPLMAWGEHESEIKCCAIDDNLVLSGDTSGVVCLFDTRSQNKIKSFQLSDSVCAVELCSSATLMAASVDGTMQLFDIRKSKERVASIETQRQLTCARSDGDRVICGDASGVVSVWTFDQMELELESKKGKSVASLCTSTDGAMIVAGFDGDVAVFASS